MSRIPELFQRLRSVGRLGLLTYLTVGYPELDSTLSLVEAVLRAGADLVELGIPFSDPIAEGKTIQGTTARALRNGVTLDFCLKTAHQCRTRTEAPLVLMGYLNPILAYGIERFARDSASAGVDGVIIVDLALEEAHEIQRAMQGAGLDLILFLAPTSTEARIETVAKLASGFIYCIAVTGVTGSRDKIGADVEDLLHKVRARTDVPLALGFGIAKPEHLQQVEGKVDAAIVGSALLDAIDESRPAESAAEFVSGMLKGVRVAG